MKGYGSVAAKSTKVDPKDECRHRIRASARPPEVLLRGVYRASSISIFCHASLFCAGARTAALGKGRFRSGSTTRDLQTKFRVARNVLGVITAPALGGLALKCSPVSELRY